MTREEFDHYRFSINTKAKYHGAWIPVTEVNFEDRKIGIESGQYLDYSEAVAKD